MKALERLVSLASKLDEERLIVAANHVDQLLALTAEEHREKVKEGEAKVRTIEAKEPDKPEKVTEIADAIRRDNPDFSDEKSFRMAWETYCSYLNPGYEGCTSKGKSKRKSPKSEYSD